MNCGVDPVIRAGNVDVRRDLGRLTGSVPRRPLAETLADPLDQAST